MPWVRGPDVGGVKIPEPVKQRTKTRILRHAEEHFAGKYTRIEFRFRAQFCYVDAYTEPAVSDDWPPADWPESREEYVERIRKSPLHLFRLRYFGDENAWAFAFYAYSSESYELSVFPSAASTERRRKPSMRPGRLTSANLRIAVAVRSDHEFGTAATE